MGYGTLTIARADFKPSFATLPFPTYMGRELLVTQFSLPGGGAGVIGNVHLESLGNADLRAKQLAACAAFMRRSTASLALLCGDFNFCSWCNYSELPQAPMPKDRGRGGGAAASTWRLGWGGPRKEELAHPPPLPLVRPRRSPPLENDLIAALFPGWVDSWPALHPAEHGFTFDTVANAMLGRHRYERMRYDRVLVRLPVPATPGPSPASAADSDAVGAEGSATAGSAASPSPTAAPASDSSAGGEGAAGDGAPASCREAAWGLADVQIIGSTALPSLCQGNPVLISDHFGLAVVLQRPSV